MLKEASTVKEGAEPVVSRVEQKGRLRPLWLLGVLWFGLSLMTVANTNVGALFAKNTWVFLLLELALLLACFLAPLAGVGLSIKRRSLRPVAWSSLNLAVALLVVYGTLMLFPRDLVIDALRGEPDVVSYYEGTQSLTILTLRKNSRFDVFVSSWPGVSRFCGGLYARSGDELHLRFEPPCDLLPERGYVRSGEILFNSRAGDPPEIGWAKPVLALKVVPRDD